MLQHYLECDELKEKRDHARFGASARRLLESIVAGADEPPSESYGGLYIHQLLEQTLSLVSLTLKETYLLVQYGKLFPANTRVSSGTSRDIIRIIYRFIRCCFITATPHQSFYYGRCCRNRRTEERRLCFLGWQDGTPKKT